MHGSTGIFARGVQAWLPENISETDFGVVFLVLNLFYSFTDGFQ